MNKTLKKIGFIGCGKMAGAIIAGIKASEGAKNLQLKGSEVNFEIAELAQNKLGIEVLTDNRLLAMDSDVIFIATKPNLVREILDEIKDEITPDKLIVSIAAGVSIDTIEGIVPNSRVVRVMPNTPALVKEGMFALAKAEYAAEEDLEFVMSLLSSIGRVIEVEESQIDIVTAISGSGPAFFYKVIEDMARAGEKLGLEYDKSLLLATQTALGSAKMVFERGEVPVQTLIDNVATKGGCTFVGITVMNEEKSDKLFYDVIEKTTQKAHELGK